MHRRAWVAYLDGEPQDHAPLITKTDIVGLGSLSVLSDHKHQHGGPRLRIACRDLVQPWSESALGTTLGPHV